MPKQTIRENISKALTLLFLVVIIAIGLNYKNPENTGLEKVVVKKIIDGDTIEIENGQQIRYIGIDTPEYGEYYFEQAKLENEKMLSSKDVYIEKDILEKDKFDRILAYVWVDKNILINNQLLEMGMAFPLFIPPNKKYQELFIKSFEKAQASDIGVWKQNKNWKLLNYREYNNI